jgi:hypothetical protein
VSTRATPGRIFNTERNAGECHRSLLVRELFADFEVVDLAPELVS